MDGAVLKKPKQIKRPKQLTLLDNDNIKAKILNKNEQEGSGHSSAFAILVYFFMIYGDRFAPKKGSPSIPRNNAQPKQSALHPGSQKGTIPTTKKAPLGIKEESSSCDSCANSWPRWGKSSAPDTAKKCLH